jgi:hypothetical protein
MEKLRSSAGGCGYSSSYFLKVEEAKNPILDMNTQNARGRSLFGTSAMIGANIARPRQKKLQTP